MTDGTLDRRGDGSARVHVGCCGFPVSRSRYFASFDAVEVQATFYDPPAPSTLARWRREAPADFRFTMKAWQLVTHDASSPTYRRLRRPPERPPGEYGSFRATAGVAAAWEATREAAEALGAEVVVFQCPPSFGPTPENVENLRRFFERVDRSGPRLAWEPRGGWPADLVARLCRELRLVHATDPFAAPPAEVGDTRYFRLHGRTGYRYRYTDGELAQVAAWCRAPGVRTAYVFFNNVAMAEDACRFREAAGTRGASQLPHG